MNISHGFGLRAHDIIGLFDKTNNPMTTKTNNANKGDQHNGNYNPEL